VTVYRKVDKFIDSISEPARKRDAILAINDLANFPFVNWDLEKLGGRDDAWRIRIGRYRIGFVVDKIAREISVYEATIK
jgi:mRNA-degrading endonuclease RelE of RelBE toxin-antitoxin system